MDQVLQNTSALISVTVEVDGTATDPSPDSATVEITRDDGTVLVATTAATNAGVGIFTYQLTPTHTTQLDILTARWKVTIGGALQTLVTRIEVAGGYVCAYQTIKGMVATTYTAAQIRLARDQATEALEDACHVSFVPRYRRETLADAKLSRAKVRTLRRVTVNGAVISASNLAVTRLVRERYLPRRQWGDGYGPLPVGNYSEAIYDRSDPYRDVIVSYEHGYDSPPGRVSRATALLAKDILVENPTDFFERASSLSTEDGTYSFVTPGVREAVFRVPECNAVVAQYGEGE